MPEQPHLAPLNAEEQWFCSETTDGGSEFLGSRTEIILHGLTKLLPCLSFSLSDHQNCIPLGMLAPISCQKGLTSPSSAFATPLPVSTNGFRDCHHDRPRLPSLIGQLNSWGGGIWSTQTQCLPLPTGPVQSSAETLCMPLPKCPASQSKNTKRSYNTPPSRGHK